MIRFPKRLRTKSIDLEDGDLVELGSGAGSDPEDLVDTGVVPPKAKTIRPPQVGSVAPVAMSTPPHAMHDETFLITRIDRGGASRMSAFFARAGNRPSLPWAAALLALGAIGSAASTRMLDALDGRSHSEPPAAAGALPPPSLAIAAPLPVPAKPAPVVLNFGAADTVTVAASKPTPAGGASPVAPAAQASPAFQAAAPVAPAPTGVVVAQTATAAPLGAKRPAPTVAAAPPAPPPADTVKRAATLDALAEQQLKAALK